MPSYTREDLKSDLCQYAEGKPYDEALLRCYNLGASVWHRPERLGAFDGALLFLAGILVGVAATLSFHA